MDKQSYRPRDIGPHNTDLISTLGVEHPEGFFHRIGKSWERFHACHFGVFSIVVGENYYVDADRIGYTNHEDYIKVNFWLSGKHTTVLNGFGQHTHDCSEVFITCGPPETIKVDVWNRNTYIACVCLCVRRDFFSTHMGVHPDHLPEPLRTLVLPETMPYGFYRLPLTPDLGAAARAILVAPPAVRRDPVYGQAKSTELMCLLINLMTMRNGRHQSSAERVLMRHESRLYKARDLLTRRYAEPITLEIISKEVGLNRMALTSGFRQLFRMSVHDYLQKERMERAFDLLQNEDYAITRVAEAVGFKHSCNFSTAFHGYFGCSPQKLRGRLR